MILLQAFPPVKSSSSSPWKGAPWQSSGEDSQALLEQLRYNDLSPTIFSPTGRLHPVERTMEQIRQPDARSNLVVALHCRDGMLMLSTVPLSPYLNTTITPLNNNNNNNNSENDENDNTTETGSTTALFLIQNEDSTDESTSESFSSTLPIVDLTPGILGATAGKVLDCQVLRLRMQALAEQLVEDDLDQTTTKCDAILVSKLARMLADQLQVPTQKTNSRQGPLLASAAVVLGHQQLWRIDPTGQFWNCHAVVVGRESDRAEEELVTKLLERMKADENAATKEDEELGSFLKSSMTCDDALDLVCECLQTIFWPASLNLQALPEGVRATIPSIPWVAVTLREGAKTSSQTTRQVRRGAFLPPRSVK